MPGVEELEAKIKDLETQLEKEKIGKKPKKDSSKYSDSSHPNTESEGESDKSTRTLRSRKKKKNNSLRNVLTKQSNILKEVGSRVLNQKGEPIENDELSTQLNGLSRTVIKEVTDNLTIGHPPEEDLVEAPDLTKNPGPHIKEFNNVLTTLKELYKEPLSGDKEPDDFVGYLTEVTRLAIGNKLNTDQFYLLLKSRVRSGNPLAYEITHSHQRGIRLPELFSSLLTLYGHQANYLATLNAFNAYIPKPGTPPVQAFAKIKMMAMKLADLSGKGGTPGDQEVFHRVRDKVLSVYPSIAVSIIEKEDRFRIKNIGDFTRTFLQLAPLVDTKRKSVHAVFENDEGRALTQTRTITHQLTDTPLQPEEHTRAVMTIKLNKEHLERLRNKCYRCAGVSSQPHHYAKDCLLYKDLPYAFYICEKCKLGVHLPSHCKQSQPELILKEETKN